MPKYLVAADAHTGVRWKTPEMADLAEKRVFHVLRRAEKTGWRLIEDGDNVEGVWRKIAELKADPYVRKVTDWRRSLGAVEVIGNHDLPVWQAFSSLGWVSDYSADGWYFVHGHQLDINTVWQQPFYRLMPWVRHFTPWELAQNNTDQYNAVIALIQMHAVELGRSQDKNVCFGHTHAYQNAQYTRLEAFFLRTFNVPSIAEDGMYAILDDRRMYLQRVPDGAGKLERLAPKPH